MIEVWKMHLATRSPAQEKSGTLVNTMKDTLNAWPWKVHLVPHVTAAVARELIGGKPPVRSDDRKWEIHESTQSLFLPARRNKRDPEWLGKQGL